MMPSPFKNNRRLLIISAATDIDDKVWQNKHHWRITGSAASIGQSAGKVKEWLNTKEVGGDGNDTNYIFLRFVVDYLPVGLVGFLLRSFSASWGSIAAAINSLASCTMVDFHRRFTKKKESGEDEYRLSKWYTLAWGIFCIVVAMFTYNIGNSLIEAVNVLGSLFYGVILGVFLVLSLLKKLKWSCCFLGGCAGRITGIDCFYSYQSRYY